MSAHEVAQSVPHRFYHGPDSMVAPHLPVGSPERAALFKRLRSTFCEDWEAAEESVARARAGKGDLYFIRCGDAVKIGRTVSIVNRLSKMQADNHADLDCLLLLKGCGKDEADWHKRFAGDRIRGEWFRLTVELEAAVFEAREANRLRAQPPSQTPWE